MSNPKYQIFVSSTYEDLKKERDAIIKAVLEMGHIPVGMEMFSAADEDSWKIIARQIDESDYYITIVAHRYGSIVNSDNVSYTEKEYDYAVARKIPVLSFIIDDKAIWPSDQMDRSAATIEALTNFKAKLKSRSVGFWSNAEELHGKASIALVKAFYSNPRPGWVRTTETSSPEIAAELARLSKENAELTRYKNENEASKSKSIRHNPALTLNDFPWLNDTVRLLGKYDPHNEGDRNVGSYYPTSDDKDFVLETTWFAVLKSAAKTFLTLQGSKIISQDMTLFARNIVADYFPRKKALLDLHVLNPDEKEIYVFLLTRGIVQQVPAPVFRTDLLSGLTERGRRLFLLLANAEAPTSVVALFIDGKRRELPKHKGTIPAKSD